MIIIIIYLISYSLYTVILNSKGVEVGVHLPGAFDSSLNYGKYFLTILTIFSFMKVIIALHIKMENKSKNHGDNRNTNLKTDKNKHKKRTTELYGKREHHMFCLTICK